MTTRKPSALVTALFLFLTLLLACPLPAGAAGAPPKRFIAIVYDDSGSMRYDGRNRDVLKNYIYANYSLQNLVALMEPRDSAKVYLISHKGRDAIAVSRKKDLYQALKNVGAAPAGDTYAESVFMAMKDGAAFLKANPGSELLLVAVTDGASMYDEQGKEIKGSLRNAFGGYLQRSGLGAYKGRASALLLSIGTAKPLSPVSDLQYVLDRSGIHAGVFLADVTKDAAAGASIMAAMTDLAEAMASTNMFAITPGRPFTIRYPLESLVIMEQSPQGSGSRIASIAGGGTALMRQTIYSTRAIGGVALASTFSSIKAKSGSIKPGRYTLKASGTARLMAFSKIGFTTSVSIADGTGREVAAYRNSRWSVDGLTLNPGEKLTGKVTFSALDGTAVQMDSHVRMGFGSPSDFTCTPGGSGAFTLQASAPGQDFLNLRLDDPEFFQIAIPALSVTVAEPQASQSNAATSTPAATLAPTATPATTAEPAGAFESADLTDISGQRIPVEYSSSGEYAPVAEFSIDGVATRQLSASFTPAIPAGLQVRFNDAVFDASTPSGAVPVGLQNTLSIWADRRFAEAAPLTLRMQFEGGQAVLMNIVPQARALSVEVDPASLEFGVLDSAAQIPGSAWRVMIHEQGQWREAGAQELARLEAVQPGGFAVSLDRQARSLSLRPSWLPVLTPTGPTAVTLRASTGKPNESAEAVVSILVRDDWRKWLYLGIGLPVFGLIAAYILLIALKKRIPMELESVSSPNADMSGAEKITVARRLLRRNFWPFGREVCAVGLLELYPHPKSPDHVILSSVSVQYGLTLDGRPPQYHKARDEAGDFILSGSTVVGIRESGAYRYYRFTYVGRRANRIARKAAKAAAR